MVISTTREAIKALKSDSRVKFIEEDIAVPPNEELASPSSFEPASSLPSLRESGPLS